jgi:hypothetical protein
VHEIAQYLKKVLNGQPKGLHGEFVIQLRRNEDTDEPKYFLESIRLY